MLIAVPRGLPRTAIAVARLAILAVLVIDLPAPDVEVEAWGFVQELGPWRGPGTDHLVRIRGERPITLRFVGAEPPDLRPDDIVTAKGRWTGNVLTVTEIVRRCGCPMTSCTERRYASSPSPPSSPPSSSSARIR